MSLIRAALVVAAALALAIPTWAGLECGRPDWFYVCPALGFDHELGKLPGAERL